MPSTVDEDEPLIICSVSYDIDPIVDMVISSIGLLEPNLFSPIATLDMVSFQSVFLPSSEDLLEAMNEMSISLLQMQGCPQSNIKQEIKSFCFKNFTKSNNELC